MSDNDAARTIPKSNIIYHLISALNVLIESYTRDKIRIGDKKAPRLLLDSVRFIQNNTNPDISKKMDELKQECRPDHYRKALFAVASDIYDFIKENPELIYVEINEGGTMKWTI